MEAVVQREVFRGLRTGWVQAGDPHHPLLLLLHGYPDSPQVWEHQLKHFQDRFQVICPYARGIGPSEKTAETRRYGRQATTLDLLEMLDQLDPGRRRPVYCAGHDLGVVHACHLAPFLGRRLKGLMLCNGLPLEQMLGRWKNLDQQRRSWYLYMMQVPGLAELVTRAAGPALFRWVHRRGGLGDAFSVEDSVEAVRAFGTYRAFFREMPEVWSRTRARLNCPALVVWGNRDPYFVIPSQDEWEGLGSQVMVRILEAGHWVFREVPDEVNALWDEFVSAK